MIKVIGLFNIWYYVHLQRIFVKNMVNLQDDTAVVEPHPHKIFSVLGSLEVAVGENTLHIYI